VDNALVRTKSTFSCVIWLRYPIMGACSSAPVNPSKITKPADAHAYPPGAYPPGAYPPHYQAGTGFPTNSVPPNFNVPPGSYPNNGAPYPHGAYSHQQPYPNSGASYPNGAYSQQQGYPSFQPGQYPPADAYSMYPPVAIAVDQQHGSFPSYTQVAAQAPAPGQQSTDPDPLNRMAAFKISEDDETPAEGNCVIAIDFGTSRSAFAYGIVGATEEIRVAVPQSAVANSAMQIKAETTMILDEKLKGIGFGLGGRKLYIENESASPGEKRNLFMFQYFKMNLKSIMSDNDQSAMATDHKGRYVPLITVITEALEYMSKAALEEVNSLGVQRKMHEIYWIITVPAIWNPAAGGFMRRAAYNAKMISSQLSQRLTLVREPEGACLDLLNSVDNKSVLVSIPAGSELVVLDCGGGTNDMTFVKIESTNPMRCSEIKAASGGAFGASNIDVSLSKFLEDLFGSARFTNMKTTVNFVEVMDFWEQFKIGFEGENTHRLGISALISEYNYEFKNDGITDAFIDQALARVNASRPREEHVMRANQTLLLKPPLLKKWFDEVINGINMDLKKDLNDKACLNVGFVYLVGGFCANKYAYSRICEFVASHFPTRQLKVFRANNPDISIVRGAVLSRLRGGPKSMVTHTIAKYTYGFSTVTAFNEKIHKTSEKFLASDGVWRVREYVLYVKKGDKIAMDFETTAQGFQPLTEQQQNLNMVLYLIDDDNISDAETIYISDPRVVKFASLQVPVNMSLPYDKRIIDISIKFGQETIIVAKDKRGQSVASASCEYFGIARQ
jgi:hypothetical protein